VVYFTSLSLFSFLSFSVVHTDSQTDSNLFFSVKRGFVTGDHRGRTSASLRRSSFSTHER